MTTDPDVLRFSDGEYRRRYQAVRQWMGREAFAALILFGNRYGGQGITWLSNFAPRHDTYLIWPLDGTPALLTQLFNHVPDAQRVSVIANTRWAGADSAATAADALAASGVGRGRVGIVGRVPFNDYNTFRVRFPEVEFVPAGKGYNGLRLVKSAEELEWLRRGAAYTDLAMQALVETAAPSVSEFELVAAIEAAYTAAGGEHGIHFLSSTPMQSPRSYVPAQTQTARRLAAGDVVISELSAGVGGYAGQIHRPIAIGGPPTPEYQRIYDIALDAYERIATVLKPGATTGQVLDAAQGIEQAGLSVCDDLLHGYGLGYLAPVLRTRATANQPQPEDFVFEERMVVVVQPNIYDPRTGAGLQVGNLLEITAGGAVSMQQYPMAFFESTV